MVNANTLPDKTRNYGLDNLKLVICLIVVIVHTTLPYTHLNTIWYFTPSLPGESMPINILINTNQLLSMPIFFIVAGYFVPTSYDKQGFGLFVWKKTKRLLIPAFIILALCMIFIQEPMFHVWFLQMLFLFCLIYALFRKLTQWKIREDYQLNISYPALFGCFILLCAVNLFVRQFCYVNHYTVLFKVFYCEPARFAEYFLTFLFGVVARRLGWFKKDSIALVIGTIITLILNSIIMGLYINEYNYIGSRLFTILEACYVIFGAYIIIWIFNKFLNKSTSFIASLSENSLGIYLFHMPLLYYVQNYTKTWEIYFPLKLALIILSVIGASYLLSFLLRKSKFIRGFI
ncbi:MAG: acyltransferase [Paludibacteraceae bacterium]|nr:acyltransferase [Paludibacteraceae bacterium]